jgi:hypothetical protein
MNIPDIELTIQTLRDAATSSRIFLSTLTTDTLRKAAECRRTSSP